MLQGTDRVVRSFAKLRQPLDVNYLPGDINKLFNSEDSVKEKVRALATTCSGVRSVDHLCLRPLLFECPTPPPCLAVAAAAAHVPGCELYRLAISASSSLPACGSDLPQTRKLQSWIAAAARLVHLLSVSDHWCEQKLRDELWPTAEAPGQRGLTLLSWNMRASYNIHRVAQALRTKAAFLAAELLRRRCCLGAVQEAPGPACGASKATAKQLGRALLLQLPYNWRYAEVVTGPDDNVQQQEAMGFVYDSHMLELVPAAPADEAVDGGYNVVAGAVAAAGPVLCSVLGEDGFVEHGSERFKRAPVLAVFRAARHPYAAAAVRSGTAQLLAAGATLAVVNAHLDPSPIRTKAEFLELDGVLRWVEATVFGLPAAAGQQLGGDEEEQNAPAGVGHAAADAGAMLGGHVLVVGDFNLDVTTQLRELRSSHPQGTGAAPLLTGLYDTVLKQGTVTNLGARIADVEAVSSSSYGMLQKRGKPGQTYDGVLCRLTAPTADTLRASASVASDMLSEERRHLDDLEAIRASQLAGLLRTASAGAGGVAPEVAGLLPDAERILNAGPNAVARALGFTARRRPAASSDSDEDEVNVDDAAGFVGPNARGLSTLVFQKFNEFMVDLRKAVHDMACEERSDHLPIVVAWGGHYRRVDGKPRVSPAI